MFPRLRDRFGAALDTVVEFSTLGEYRVGASLALAPSGAQPAVSDRVGPISGWEASPAESGEDAGADQTHRTVAGGAAALHGNAPGRALLGASAATPAASRRLAHGPRPVVERARRPGSPAPPPQDCLSA